MLVCYSWEEGGEGGEECRSKARRGRVINNGNNNNNNNDNCTEKREREREKRQQLMNKEHKSSDAMTGSSPGPGRRGKGSYAKKIVNCISGTRQNLTHLSTLERETRERRVVSIAMGDGVAVSTLCVSPNADSTTMVIMMMMMDAILSTVHHSTLLVLDERNILCAPRIYQALT